MERKIKIDYETLCMARELIAKAQVDGTYSNIALPKMPEKVIAKLDKLINE